MACNDCREYRITGRTLKAFEADRIACGFVIGIMVGMFGMMLLRYLVTGSV